jgi:hypothetical protein
MFLHPQIASASSVIAPPMAAYAAIIDRRRRRSIVLGSLLAAIALTIQVTKAHQQLISPRPNSSSIPPSAPWGTYLNTPMPNPKYMRLHLTSSLTKSSSTTAFATLSLLMVGFTSRFVRGFMVFPKLVSLKISYLRNPLLPKGTTSANTHLVSGATSGGTSLSAWW